MGAANETAKDETVNASSVSNLHYESGYSCYLPLNCYVGHGADDIDYVGDVPSISACAGLHRSVAVRGFRLHGDAAEVHEASQHQPGSVRSRRVEHREQRVSHVLVR